MEWFKNIFFKNSQSEEKRIHPEKRNVKEKKLTKHELLRAHIKKKISQGDDFGLRLGLRMQGYSETLINKIIREEYPDISLTDEYNRLDGVLECQEEDDKREERKERRREGRKKKAFGRIICQDGVIAMMESGDYAYESFVKVKEGEINQRTLKMGDGVNTVEIIPKTKEAFVEIQKRSPNKRILKIQSVYLIKNKKSTKKVFFGWPYK